MSVVEKTLPDQSLYVEGLKESSGVHGFMVWDARFMGFVYRVQNV